MGKTYRKQFWTKFIEGDKRAHRKLRHICRCDYCMGIRKRGLQIKEKQKEIKEYLDTQFNWLEYCPDNLEVISSNLISPTVTGSSPL